MIEEQKDLSKTKAEVTNLDSQCNPLTKNILFLNAIACNSIENVESDRRSCQLESLRYLKELKADGAIQEMLAAQILSIHRLQQRTMAMVNMAITDDSRAYNINTAIKLANVFTQQAALLTKLQGGSNQKINVEHVEVHQGGQAVVGNISTSYSTDPTDKEKK